MHSYKNEKKRRKESIFIAKLYQHPGLVQTTPCLICSMSLSAPITEEIVVPNLIPTNQQALKQGTVL